MANTQNNAASSTATAKTVDATYFVNLEGAKSRGRVDFKAVAVKAFGVSDKLTPVKLYKHKSKKAIELVANHETYGEFMAEAMISEEFGKGVYSAISLRRNAKPLGAGEHIFKINVQDKFNDASTSHKTNLEVKVHKNSAGANNKDDMQQNTVTRTCAAGTAYDLIPLSRSSAIEYGRVVNTPLSARQFNTARVNDAFDDGIIFASGVRSGPEYRALLNCTQNKSTFLCALETNNKLYRQYADALLGAAAANCYRVESKHAVEVKQIFSNTISALVANDLSWDLDKVLYFAELSKTSASNGSEVIADDILNLVRTNRNNYRTSFVGQTHKRDRQAELKRAKAEEKHTGSTSLQERTLENMNTMLSAIAGKQLSDSDQVLVDKITKFRNNKDLPSKKDWNAFVTIYDMLNESSDGSQKEGDTGNPEEEESDTDLSDTDEEDFTYNTE